MDDIWIRNFKEAIPCVNLNAIYKALHWLIRQTFIQIDLQWFKLYIYINKPKPINLFFRKLPWRWVMDLESPRLPILGVRGAFPPQSHIVWADSAGAMVANKQHWQWWLVGALCGRAGRQRRALSRRAVWMRRGYSGGRCNTSPGNATVQKNTTLKWATSDRP